MQLDRMLDLLRMKRYNTTSKVSMVTFFENPLTLHMLTWGVIFLSVRKRFCLIAAAAMLCVFIYFINKNESGGLKDFSVTKIELGTSHYSDCLDQVYFLSSEPDYFELSEVQSIYAVVYADQNILNQSSVLEKAVRWVSSNPRVISVRNKYRDGKFAFEMKVNESVVSEGVYSIYAENFDGSVKSEAIQIVIGAPAEAIKKLSLSYTPYFGVSQTDTMYLDYDADVKEKARTLSLKAYTYEDEEFKSKGVEKHIRWVSSNPEIVSISPAKKTAFDLTVQAIVTLNNEGIAELYAETDDGRVKSEPIKVVVGAPTEAIKKLSLGTSSQSDTIQFDSAPNEQNLEKILSLKAYSFEDELFKNKGVEKHIRWVSSDPDIISVSPVQNVAFGFSAHTALRLKQEGIVELYAETDDGRVRSNRITVAYGNQFNKEFLATDFAAKYVLDHLRYKTKVSEYNLTDLWITKTFFIKGNQLKLGYSKFSDTSTVETKKTTINGDEVTVTGIVETYTETFSSIRFSFAVRFRYIPNSNYTSYELVSANYELPEYIIRDVAIED